MNAKHTSGPWKITRFADGTVGVYASFNGPSIEIATLRRRFADANAQLVAAAPDLLENLIGCIEVFVSHAPDCIEVQCARDAIANVTGEIE